MQWQNDILLKNLKKYIARDKRVKLNNENAFIESVKTFIRLYFYKKEFNDFEEQITKETIEFLKKQKKKKFLHKDLGVTLQLKKDDNKEWYVAVEEKESNS